jgi:hypothetical protein
MDTKGKNENIAEIMDKIEYDNLSDESYDAIINGLEEEYQASLNEDNDEFAVD